jgi:hypothetical protein
MGSTGFNCMTRDKNFKRKMETAYRNGTFPYADTNLVGQGDTVDAHHIQELEWGGNNTLDNGVLLLESDHNAFTYWWKGVSGY